MVSRHGNSSPTLLLLRKESGAAAAACSGQQDLQSDSRLKDSSTTSAFSRGAPGHGEHTHKCYEKIAVVQDDQHRHRASLMSDRCYAQVYSKENVLELPAVAKMSPHANMDFRQGLIGVHPFDEWMFARQPLTVRERKVSVNAQAERCYCWA